MLEVNKIDVFYGTHQVLREISMKVSDHETVGIFGANGHGKTTILRTISGLLKPKRGNIIFDGKTISNLSPYKIVELGVVQILQGRHLFPDMTVMENLLLGAYATNVWKDRYNNLEEVFRIFPKLKKRQDQLCSTLSGGERQMVSIGRGLMSSGKLLMLDEPSLGLAPKLVLELEEKIQEIKKAGISVILVEQNVKLIEALCARAYLIQRGEVALEGNIRDIYSDEDIRKAYLGR